MKRAFINRISQYWKEQANEIFWYSFPKKILKFNKFKKVPSWYLKGKTNVCFNCLDLNILRGLEDKIAIHEINSKGEIENFSYKKLFIIVNYFSKFLKNNFRKKIKRVMIHSSASIESAVCMLSCSRLGITHNVIFEDLEKEAIEKRIKLFKPDIFVSNTNLKRFNNIILPTLKKFKKIKLIYLKKQKNKKKGVKEVNLRKNTSKIFGDSKVFCKKIESSQNLFVLFTSGSTGLPKGIVHSTGGYLTFAKYTCKNNFGMNINSIVLTASDAGWINGHTYALYGPLSFGATTILFEKPSIILNEKIFKKILLKLKPTVIYLPVTLIRILRSLKSKKILSRSVKSLGSMGEPLAPEVAKWYSKNFNLTNKPIINTYFQTETGGIISSPKYNESVSRVKFGTVGRPSKIFGLKLISNKSLKKKEVVISNPWPGCMSGVLNGKKIWNKYWDNENNFRLFDSGSYDKVGNLIVHGRTDDVINIRGHRIGSAEIESVLLENKNIIEACAVATDDYLEGSILNIFIVTNVKKDIIESKVKKTLLSNFGSYAIPKKLYNLRELPKTKSGKILRRLLRDLILNKKNLGDLSTMTNRNKIGEIKEIIKKN